MADHSAMDPISFKEKYKFSWQSIAEKAAEKGFYTKKRRSTKNKSQSTTANLSGFSVSDFSSDEKMISRSVQLRPEVYERLKLFEKDKHQYTKTAILNELIDESLNKYGY